jgi:hypothetical protein
MLRIMRTVFGPDQINPDANPGFQFSNLLDLRRPHRLEVGDLLGLLGGQGLEDGELRFLFV